MIHITEFDKKKAYLKGYHWKLKKYYNALDDLIKYRDGISSAKTTNYDAIAGGKLTTIDDKLIVCDLLEDKVNDKVLLLKKELEKILYTISLLEDPREKYVLEQIYIYNHPIEMIAEDIDRSDRQTKRIHVDAINNLILPK